MSAILSQLSAMPDAPHTALNLNARVVSDILPAAAFDVVASDGFPVVEIPIYCGAVVYYDVLTNHTKLP